MQQRKRELGETTTHADFGEVLRGDYARTLAYPGSDMDRGMMSCSSVEAWRVLYDAAWFDG